MWKWILKPVRRKSCVTPWCKMPVRLFTRIMLKVNSRAVPAQGIGWALNEEYVYGDDGRLQNAGFLDYRIPVCSDLPFIDTQILEIPNPNHPYGVRGVGETSIVPPLAAIGNAVSNAVGVRMDHVPMSPPRILKAIEAAQG